MEIGAKLSKIRRDKELSVYKLSKNSEVSENYIHEVEKGEKQPSVYILEKLLTAMGVTLAEFFNESEDVIYPSDFEKKLVQAVRVLPEDKANAVLNISELLS